MRHFDIMVNGLTGRCIVGETIFKPKYRFCPAEKLKLEGLNIKISHLPAEAKA